MVEEGGGDEEETEGEDSGGKGRGKGEARRRGEDSTGPSAVDGIRKGAVALQPWKQWLRHLSNNGALQRVHDVRLRVYLSQEKAKLSYAALGTHGIGSHV